MSDRASRHFRIRTLAPGVHAAIATPGGFGLCNAGIVDLGGETVVFDTMLTPMAARDLVRAAERTTGRRPTWVVNSHWHGDHIWGNSSFPGSHIVSSREVRKNILQLSRSQFEANRLEMRRELPRIDRPGSGYPKADRETVRGWFQGVLAIPRPHRIVPPGVTFADELVLEGSRRSLRVATYGGGHSPSDVFAFLPDEKVLFAGDLAMRGLHPSVGDGWPASWISILRRMEKLHANTILPGHGPVGPGGTLSTTRSYLLDLDRLARAAIRDGMPPREVARIPIPSRYRRWNFSFMFPGNLSRAYRLARSGIPREGR
jgi:cyclase